jgi:hypothetical protein
MTHRKKDLFDLFRDQQHRMNEAPSPRAWRNLESRLDSHRRRNRLSLVRNLSMAAALLLLAVIAVVLSLSIDSVTFKRVNRGPIAAEALNANQAEAAEELRLAVSAQQAEQQRRNPIHEGAQDQKLIPATLSVSHNETAAPSLKAFNWLLGNWQAANGQREWSAYWENVGQHAIEGACQLDNSQRTKETIRLHQTDGTLFFASNFGKSEALVTYSLSQYSAKRMVFDNPEASFPKRVILIRDGMNSYSLVYLNPDQQTEAQADRPTLSSKQVVRRMQRLQLQ